MTKTLSELLNIIIDYMNMTNFVAKCQGVTCGSCLYLIPTFTFHFSPRTVKTVNLS